MRTLSGLCPSDLQDVWNHSRDSGTGPFDVVDALGDTVVRLLDRCEPLDGEVGEYTVLNVINGDSGWYESFLSRKKGKDINCNVLVGLLVAGWANTRWESFDNQTS